MPEMMSTVYYDWAYVCHKIPFFLLSFDLIAFDLKYHLHNMRREQYMGRKICGWIAEEIDIRLKEFN